jgi:hypothetical protein
MRVMDRFRKGEDIKLFYKDWMGDILCGEKK